MKLGIASELMSEEKKELIKANYPHCRRLSNRETEVQLDSKQVLGCLRFFLFVFVLFIFVLFFFCSSQALTSPNLVYL